MRSIARWKLLVAAAVAAIVLVVLLLRVQRAPAGADAVITHEVRDLVATFQEPLEVADVTPWNGDGSGGRAARAGAALGVLVLGVLVWMRTHGRTSPRHRERNSSS